MSLLGNLQKVGLRRYDEDPQDALQFNHVVDDQKQISHKKRKRRKDMDTSVWMPISRPSK